MKKKVGLLLGILLLGGLIWYLFIKSHDYQVSFREKASPGTINQVIKLWGEKADNAKLIEQNGLSYLKYKIHFNDSAYTYEWHTKYLNDSIAQVKVFVTDLENSLMNKIKIPFSETDFEKRTNATLTEVLKKLHEHSRSFKVTIKEYDTIPSSYCAYVPLKSSQIGKARQMMQNYPLLDGMIASNKIRTNGRPFIQVNHWNMENDSISFDFCYPIIKTDSLPEHKIIKYKQFSGGTALKAVYNGNYITSDRAWYALLDYAKKKNIDVYKKPHEVFHTNPNFGGNELNWEAEIYMPLKK